MKYKRPSQNDQLLTHFQTRGSISGIEAAAMFRIRSLTRRICDLKAKGFKFASETKRDTTGQRYVRYHFMGR